MTNPLIERLRDLEPYSPAWFEARDKLAADDPDAFGRWLDDEWSTDQALRELERATIAQPGVNLASDATGDIDE